jgi:hypothetical protein
MKEDKVFLDTNILVYAYDISSGSKYDIELRIPSRYQGLVKPNTSALSGIISTLIPLNIHLQITLLSKSFLNYNNLSSSSNFVNSE